MARWPLSFTRERQVLLANGVGPVPAKQHFTVASYKGLSLCGQPPWTQLVATALVFGQIRWQVYPTRAAALGADDPRKRPNSIARSTQFVAVAKTGPRGKNVMHAHKRAIKEQKKRDIKF